MGGGGKNEYERRPNFKNYFSKISFVSGRHKRGKEDGCTFLASSYGFF